MRISGTESSSVILSQTKKFKKLKSDDPKVPKQQNWGKGLPNLLTITMADNELCYLRSWLRMKLKSNYAKIQKRDMK